MNKGEINKQLMDLKLKKLLLLGKKISLLVFGNIVLITGLKVSGAGYPFIRDKEKEYCVSAVTINNINNNKKIKEKYLKGEDLKKYEDKNNLLYIKDNYRLDNDFYIKNVKVYKLDDMVDYEEILENYNNYIKSLKLLDEYDEKTNYCYQDMKKKEIIIKFYNVDKDNYITVFENNLKNILTSSTFIFLFTFYGGFYIYYSFDDFNKISKDIKKLKIIKKDI